MSNYSGISYIKEEDSIKMSMKNGSITEKISDSVFGNWLNSNHLDIYEESKPKHVLDSGIWKKVIEKYPEIKTEYFYYLDNLQ